jgi:hypothetical protein
MGTMVGWKRVVLTIGEKIGKQGMTYAQGMSAQITTASLIGLANIFSLPVSTTTSVVGCGRHHGRQQKRPAGRHRQTILLAWVLTLPATVGLSAGLFWLEGTGQLIRSRTNKARSADRAFFIDVQFRRNSNPPLGANPALSISFSQTKKGDRSRPKCLACSLHLERLTVFPLVRVLPDKNPNPAKNTNMRLTVSTPAITTLSKNMTPPAVALLRWD